MPEQPPRRKTMGDVYAKVWPNATPDELAQLYDLLGDPSEMVPSFKDVMRLFEEDSGEK
jgi:hypothetical protein